MIGKAAHHQFVQQGVSALPNAATDVWRTRSQHQLAILGHLAWCNTDSLLGPLGDAPPVAFADLAAGG
jgi:hypothetical protein